MKHNEPLVSIIITFYNEEYFLERCLESVKNQTYKNLEVILINDGSTDSSLKIAEKFYQEFYSCKIITIENSGPGNARNIALVNCTGEFVTFLDADDDLENVFLERMLENIVFSNSDMNMAMYTIYDKNRDIIKRQEWLFDNKVTAKEAISLVIKQKLIPTVWGKLFKTSFAKRCKFLNARLKEDDIFILEYIQIINNISIVKEYLININCKLNSLTRQTISLQMINSVQMSFDKQFELLVRYDNKSLEIDLLENQLNTFLNLFLIIKMDWNDIKERKHFLTEFQNQISLIEIKSKKYILGYKKRILLFILKSTSLIGYQIPLFFVAMLKKNQYKRLVKMKF